MKRQVFQATEERPYHLLLEGVSICSAPMAAAMFANAWADEGRNVILISTRQEAQPNKQNGYLLLPHEVEPAVAGLQAVDAGRRDTVVVIDAQPVYDSGRVLHTIKPARVEQIKQAFIAAIPHRLHAIQIFQDAADMPDQQQAA